MILHGCQMPKRLVLVLDQLADKKVKSRNSVMRFFHRQTAMMLPLLNKQEKKSDQKPTRPANGKKNMRLRSLDGMKNSM